jgi:hypothetical protein
MQKFSNSTSNQIEDEEIEEDIKYDGKFDLIQDEIEDGNDEFVESISKLKQYYFIYCFQLVIIPMTTNLMRLSKNYKIL